MSESERPVVEKRRSRKWIYWIGGLLVLYIAFGFLGVPRIVESVMTSQVESALEAELNVERVAFNPLTLRLQIEGLELRDAQGETVMLLGKGRFALSLKSIYQFAGV
ncbi:MAG: hypothetical protein JJU20_06030, partial [Opitutales bacterium]|nr:hypothetical protein [Opitutales bacterium]